MNNKSKEKTIQRFPVCKVYVHNNNFLFYALINVKLKRKEKSEIKQIGKVHTKLKLYNIQYLCVCTKYKHK